MNFTYSDEYGEVFSFESQSPTDTISYSNTLNADDRVKAHIRSVADFYEKKLPIPKLPVFQLEGVADMIENLQKCKDNWHKTMEPLLDDVNRITSLFSSSLIPLQESVRKNAEVYSKIRDSIDIQFRGFSDVAKNCACSFRLMNNHFSDFGQIARCRLQQFEKSTFLLKEIADRIEAQYGPGFRFSDHLEEIKRIRDEVVGEDEVPIVDKTIDKSDSVSQIRNKLFVFDFVKVLIHGILEFEQGFTLESVILETFIDIIGLFVEYFVIGSSPIFIEISNSLYLTYDLRTSYDLSLL